MAIEPLHCLFCLKRVDNDERSNYDCFNEHTAKGVSADTAGSLLYSKFIKFVREYLKLEGDDNPLFSNTCSVSVGLSQFCVCCENVISTICRLWLYSDLLEAQLRLSWKLGELGELLEGSEQRVSFKLWNVLIKLVGSQLSFKGGVVVEAAHVKEFRGGLQRKCAQKGKGNLPRVIVERISVPIESFQRRSGIDGASSSVPWIAEIDDDGKTQDDEQASEASFKRTTSPSKPLENDDDDIKVEVESVLGDYEGEDNFNEDCWGADVTNLHEDEDYEDYNVSGPGQSHPQRFRRITRRKRQRMQLKGWEDDGDDCSTIENNVDTESIKIEDHSGSEVNFDSTSENTSSENDSGSDWSEGATDRKKSKKPTTSRKTLTRRVGRTTPKKTNPDEDIADFQERKLDKLLPHNIKDDDAYLQTCEHCDKFFKSASDFNRHIKNMERDRYMPRLEKKYKCFFCWRTFAYHQSFQFHIRSQHRKCVNLSKPLFCSEPHCIVVKCSAPIRNSTVI